jgi:hypothetical protein
MSKGRLCDFAGCQLEELEKFVMPGLLVATSDDPAMVTVTSRGYAVTHRGLEELDRRGIPHRGEEVVAEGGQRLDFGSWDTEEVGTGDEGAVRAAVITPPLPALPPPLPAPSPPSLPVITPPTRTFMALPVITPPWPWNQ